jgi:hypothetical protein
MNGESRSFKIMTEAIVATRASPLPTLTAVDDVSAASWAAAIAGPFVTSAFSLALVALGAGIDLVSVSPWSSNNPSVTTFGALATAWFTAARPFASRWRLRGRRLRFMFLLSHSDAILRLAEVEQMT